MSESVLVVSPHFDDESIGCGGTILRHVAGGDTVNVAFITRGDSGDIRMEMSGAQMAEIRRAEAVQACRVLGVTSETYLDYEEGFLTHSEALEKDLVRLIREQKPSLVYAPHSAEAHTDHRGAALAVKAAARKASLGVFPHLGVPKHAVREVRFYEIWTPLQEFDLVVDISRYIDAKVAAISCYQSQVSSRQYPEAMLGLSRYRGLLAAGVNNAEVFATLSVRPRTDD